jgi:hypothetical protein
MLLVPATLVVGNRSSMSVFLMMMMMMIIVGLPVTQAKALAISHAVFFAEESRPTMYTDESVVVVALLQPWITATAKTDNGS